MIDESELDKIEGLLRFAVSDGGVIRRGRGLAILGRVPELVAEVRRLRLVEKAMIMMNTGLTEIIATSLMREPTENEAQARDSAHFPPAAQEAGSTSSSGLAAFESTAEPGTLPVWLFAPAAPVMLEPIRDDPPPLSPAEVAIYLDNLREFDPEPEDPILAGSRVLREEMAEFGQMPTRRDWERDLAEIEERANAATPGPWEWYPADREIWSGPTEIVKSYDDAWQIVIDDEDADFIAHSRQDVPELIAEVRRLRGKIDRICDDWGINDGWEEWRDD